MGTVLATAPKSELNSRPNSPANSASNTGTARSTEARVREATLTCIARFGSAKTTLDDVARESGVSRATIYRVFPGGRDTLFESVLAAEIDRFFRALGSELERHDDLEELLVGGIGQAMRFLVGHEALRTIVALEPELLLPRLAFHRLQGVLTATTAFIAPHLEPHLASAGHAVSAAEHVVRIVLSYTLHPSDRVDPDDERSVRALVRGHVLPGLRRNPAHADTDSHIQTEKEVQ